MNILPNAVQRRSEDRPSREEYNACPHNGGLEYISTAIEITELNTSNFEEMGYEKRMIDFWPTPWRVSDLDTTYGLRITPTR
jgi:hypothetical protein